MDLNSAKTQFVRTCLVPVPSTKSSSANQHSAEKRKNDNDGGVRGVIVASPGRRGATGSVMSAITAVCVRRFVTTATASRYTLRVLGAGTFHNIKQSVLCGSAQI
mmetsp:Transcript_6009/g.11024  ORF Transcript_6009/g.11024 Transcript_6009/m.11024 type:complete len:105 (+) Transcript_6009:280-594(+)